jgi:hypothetical protein
MSTRAAHVAFCVLLIFGMRVEAKGADGLVILKGTLQHAAHSADEVSFEFTGRFSFTFFTAALDSPDRKQVDLDLEVHDLRVVVPVFGESEQSSDDPYTVNFANAVRHALAASRSGERVTAVLFNPRLSFGIGGVLEQATCTHAQVLPARFERRLDP